MRVYGKGVGARIRVFRKKKGLSLTDLSRLTGIAASNLSSIELNKTSPTLNTLVKIADAFQMKVGAFLDEVLYGAVVFCPAADSSQRIAPQIGVSVAGLTAHVEKSEMDIREIRMTCEGQSFGLGKDKDTFIYCILGKAKITANATDHTLQAGDGIYLRACTDAECTVGGNEEALLLTMTVL